MKSWKFWIGVLISVVFLWLALRGLKLGEVWDTLKGANYWWLIPGVLVYFLGVWVRAWRWHYLLGPVKKISTAKMFPIVTIGYMGNNIYPARAGEVLRAVILRRDEGVPISVSLATIIVERIFDGVVMLSFVFLNLPRLASLSSDSGFIGSIRQLALWGSVIFAAALGAFLLAAMFPKQAMKLGVWGITHLTPQRFHEKLLGITGKFLDGLASLRSPYSALMIFLTSAVIWLLETGKYWFVMHAFPFVVDWFVLLLMNGTVNLATTIPSAPGYVGTFDATGIAVLVAAGVDRAVAAGYTLLLHVALWFPVTILGAFYLAKTGIKWGEAVEKARSEGDNPVDKLG